MTCPKFWGGYRIIILGIILYYIYVTQPPIDKWISLTIPDKGKVGYKADAILNELQLPKITNINGEAKFLSRDKDYYLGYKLKFDIEHLDTTKVSKEYLIDKQDTINGVAITFPKIKEVQYEASFVFILIDKDGFELEKIESQKEYIESGRKNEIQNIIEKSIPLNTIKLTKKMG